MRLDRSIPYFNILMGCSRPLPFEAPLPAGYCFRFFASGDERRWAEIETDIGDFGSIEEAEAYFAQKYLPHAAELSRRCLFLIAPDGQAVGSCIAWQDPKGDIAVSSLHWLAVKEAEQGKGFGKALLGRTLAVYESLGGFPVYLHTQPWSYAAVSLYWKAGFRLLRDDAFADYLNQNKEALEVLRRYLPLETMVQLQSHLQ